MQPYFTFFCIKLNKKRDNRTEFLPVICFPRFPSLFFLICFQRKKKTHSQRILFNFCRMSNGKKHTHHTEKIVKEAICLYVYRERLVSQCPDTFFRSQTRALLKGLRLETTHTQIHACPIYRIIWVVLARIMDGQLFGYFRAWRLVYISLWFYCVFSFCVKNNTSWEIVFRLPYFLSKIYSTDGPLISQRSTSFDERHV